MEFDGQIARPLPYLQIFKPKVWTVVHAERAKSTGRRGQTELVQSSETKTDFDHYFRPFQAVI